MGGNYSKYIMLLYRSTLVHTIFSRLNIIFKVVFSKLNQVYVVLKEVVKAYFYILTLKAIGLVNLFVTFEPIWYWFISICYPIFVSLFYKPMVLILSCCLNILWFIPEMLIGLYVSWIIFTLFHSLLSKIHSLRYKKKKMKKKLHFKLLFCYLIEYILFLIFFYLIINIIRQIFNVTGAQIPLSIQITILFLFLFLLIFKIVIVRKNKGSEYLYKKYLPLCFYNCLVFFILRTLFLVICPSDYLYLLITPIGLLLPDIYSYIKLILGNPIKLLGFVSLDSKELNLENPIKLLSFVSLDSKKLILGNRTKLLDFVSLDSKKPILKIIKSFIMVILGQCNSISVAHGMAPEGNKINLNLDDDRNRYINLDSDEVEASSNRAIYPPSEQVNSNNSIVAAQELYSAWKLYYDTSANYFKNTFSKNVIVDIAHSPSPQEEYFRTWLKNEKPEESITKYFSRYDRGGIINRNQMWTPNVNAALYTLYKDATLLLENEIPIRCDMFAIIAGWSPSTSQVELFLVKAKELRYTCDGDKETVVTMFVKEDVSPERPRGKVRTVHGKDENLVYAGEAIFTSYRGNSKVTISYNGISVPYDPSNVNHSKKPLVANSNGKNLVIGESRLNLMRDKNQIAYISKSLLIYSTPYIYRKI